MQIFGIGLKKVASKTLSMVSLKTSTATSDFKFHVFLTKDNLLPPFTFF